MAPRLSGPTSIRGPGGRARVSRGPRAARRSATWSDPRLEVTSATGARPAAEGRTHDLGRRCVEPLGVVDGEQDGLLHASDRNAQRPGCDRPLVRGAAAVVRSSSATSSARGCGMGSDGGTPRGAVPAGRSVPRARAGPRRSRAGRRARGSRRSPLGRRRRARASFFLRPPLLRGQPPGSASRPPRNAWIASSSASRPTTLARWPSCSRADHARRDAPVSPRLRQSIPIPRVDRHSVWFATLSRRPRRPSSDHGHIPRRGVLLEGARVEVDQWPRTSAASGEGGPRPCRPHVRPSYFAEDETASSSSRLPRRMRSRSRPAGRAITVDRIVRPRR